MVKKTKKQAFTIVELVIVIAVIAILAAIIIPTYSNLVKKANEATALVDAKNMITEMLADILSGDKDAADIIVFSKKGDSIFVYGYDADAGRVLTYHGNPIKAEGNFADQVGNGTEITKDATKSTLLAQMLNKDEITPRNPQPADGEWNNPEVLNNPGGTVEGLGFDRSTMAVFANYDIVPESFAKKNSGGEEVHTHVWATEWNKNSTHHWHDCTAEGCTVTVDSEKDGYGAHNWGDGVVTTEPTESTEGEKTFTCTACGATKMEKIPAIGHVCKDHLTHHDRVEATCTEEGKKEYWHCSGCDKYFTDEAGTKETTLEALTISAKGHTYKYTDNGNGSTHKVTCEKGDLQAYSENHDFDANGKCTKCGYQKSTLDFSNPVYLYKSGTFSIERPNTTSAKISYTNPAKTFDKIADALNEADAGDCIKLNGDLTESVSLKKSITLDLNGKTLTGGSGSVITLSTSSVTLNIFDSSNGNGKITGGTGYDAYGSGSGLGGGVYTNQASATINLYSGSIHNNSAQSGGGIYVNGSNSAVNIYGGSVSGNSAGDGAGIYIQTGQLNIYGGSISDNKFNTSSSNGDGGGVYMASSTTLNITGGTISGNEAKSGGGVYLNRVTTVTIKNCKISNNKATSEGGGIYASSSGDIDISGVIISGNSAISTSKTGIGGGIYATGTNVTVLDGTKINNNTATANANNTTQRPSGSGAGIYFVPDYGDATLKLLGGEITGNTANTTNSVGAATTGLGGGVFVEGSKGTSTVTIDKSQKFYWDRTNCKIESNDAWNGKQIGKWAATIRYTGTDEITWVKNSESAGSDYASLRNAGDIKFATNNWDGTTFN